MKPTQYSTWSNRTGGRKRCILTRQGKLHHLRSYNMNSFTTQMGFCEGIKSYWAFKVTQRQEGVASELCHRNSLALG